MAAPDAKSPITIQVDGELVSVPYVEMTLAMMKAWGVQVETERDAAGAYRSLTVAAPQSYRAQNYAIEPDASSASYFWAAAAITGGGVFIPGMENSCQGDVAFRDLLVK